MVSGSGGFVPLKSGWEMSEPSDRIVWCFGDYPFSYKIDIDC